MTVAGTFQYRVTIFHAIGGIAVEDMASRLDVSES
jgi:hypothetical protein